MEKPKLTKTYVDSVPLCDAGQKIYRDSELPGFLLRVTKVKTYGVERKVNGKTVRVSIGAHGVFTPTEARERARQILGEMAAGTNPNAVKREKIREAASASINPTLADAHAGYVGERKLAANTLRDYEKCINGYFSDWSDKPMVGINRTMVQQRHSLLTESSPARANMAMRYLRALFNWASEHYFGDGDTPVITSNPVRTLSAKRAWNTIKPRTGHIDRPQLRAWFRAVMAFEDEHAGSVSELRDASRDYLLTIVLTGFRREECASLPWSEVDLINGTITSRDPKNHEPHTLPMGPFLLSILRRRAERSTTGYVFPAPGKTGHIVDRRDAIAKIAEASGVEFGPHALRRTFATIVEGLDTGYFTQKKLLNHKIRGDVTALYPQISKEKLLFAMIEVERYVLGEAGWLPLA